MPMLKQFEIKGIRFGQGRPVICVPVVEHEHEAVVEKIRGLSKQKTQMIEWRVDCFDHAHRPEEVRSILEEIAPFVKDTVMLFTYRTKAQGGNGLLDEDKILFLDETAAKSGSIDLIDLEYFALDHPERAVRRLRRTDVRIIASHHDFHCTPDDGILTQLMGQLAGSGADIAKLAVMPNSVDDLVRLLRLTNDTKQKYPDLPLIVIAMGNLGVITRVTGEAFGSCISFGADGEVSAPGQLQADTLALILDALHESMKGAPPSGHVFLIGFMGAGKTTVSSRLTELTGAEEIELDEAIERENGMRVAEIFDQYGEEYFRDEETRMLGTLAGRDPAVISCGGGCVLREGNADILRKSGTTILLTARPETIYARVKDQTERPLLEGHMNVDYISELMEQRRPAYEAAADLVITTDDKTPDEIASEILEKLSR